MYIVYVKNSANGKLCKIIYIRGKCKFVSMEYIVPASFEQEKNEYDNLVLLILHRLKLRSVLRIKLNSKPRQ